ncbi:MAG TPA: protein kinase, partial [Terriglobales bacterium]|nr:protein kinase [Terriglobales bacterium]
PVKPITQAGTVVGTFQYMSPEQVQGQEADARSDIFALGAVLYEMVTGKRAFEGKSAISVASAILEKEPEPISALQPMTPPALDQVVRGCLRKEPEERYQSAHDVKLQLKWIAEGGSQAGAPAVVVKHRRHREWVAWGAAALLLAAATILGAAALRRYLEQPQVVRFAIPQPEGASFRFGIFGGSPAPAAISPDGKLVVFGADAGGKRLLWVRPLNAFEARPLEGTQGAQYPFWSPDSRWVGFFADGKLKKIEASGQTPTETLCDAPDGRGGTWNREGVIVFQPTSTATSLQQVSENGGTPAAVGPPVTEKNLSLRWPFFLPDGKHFLFTIGSPSLQKKQTGGGIFVGSLDSQESRRILEDDSNAVYVPSGHLLFVRDQVLMAIEFDAPTLKTRGGVRPLAESVQYEPLRWMGHFSASQTGTLLFWKGTASPARQLTWFDRSGKVLGKFGEPDNYLGIRLSPGGKQVAAVIGGSGKQNVDIWLLDLERGGRTRFTFSPAADVAPVWSPDQKDIVYSSQESGAFDLYLKAANGASSEHLLFQSSEGKIATDWSADGKTILFNAIRSHVEIWAYSLAGHKAAPVLSGDFNYVNSVFSP